MIVAAVAALVPGARAGGLRVSGELRDSVTESGAALSSARAPVEAEARVLQAGAFTFPPVLNPVFPPVIKPTPKFTFPPVLNPVLPPVLKPTPEPTPKPIAFTFPPVSFTFPRVLQADGAASTSGINPALDAVFRATDVGIFTRKPTPKPTPEPTPKTIALTFPPVLKPTPKPTAFTFPPVLFTFPSTLPPVLTDIMTEITIVG